MDDRLAPLLLVREDRAGYDADAVRLATALLERFELVAEGRAHRVEELELYLFGPRHQDPFAHRDPIQAEPGRWYFHKTGRGYRGGSYKGLDLTFGRSGAFGGVLLRSLRADDGTLVEGPSLCVDRILRCTGGASVAELDARIGGARATDPGSILHLREAPRREVDIVRTARVGLTLKRCALPSEMPAFLLRPDRFLTAPREIKKGRVHTVVALHQRGLDPEAIHAATGSPRASIGRVLASYRAGLARPSFAEAIGRAPGATELARLHGAWFRLFGPGLRAQETGTEIAPESATDPARPRIMEP